MNRNTTLLLIAAVVISILVKLAVFSFGNGDPLLDFIPKFGYMLVIILMLFFTIQMRVNANPSESFVIVFKESTKPAAIYVALISAFTYLYYTNIDPTYFATRIQGRIQEARDKGYDEETIGKLRDQMETFAFNVDTILAGTLMGFLFFALISGGFLTLVVRKMHELRNQPSAKR